MHTQFLLPFSLLLTAASAHFKLNYPPSIGFDDDKESEGPCGSFDITSRKGVTAFPVSGGVLAVLATHPEVKWEFRAALLNDTANFKVITSPAVISQTGQGDFCEQGLMVPKEWEGQQGVIQAVQNSADAEGGFLYQCAAVNFTAATTKPDSAAQSACKNSTNVKAEFVQGTLTIPAASAATGTTSASPSASKKSAAGASFMIAGANVFGVALLVAGLLL